MESKNDSKERNLTPEEKSLINKQANSELKLKMIVAQVLADENPAAPEEPLQVETATTLLQRNFGAVYYLLRFMARRNLFPNFMDFVSLHEACNFLEVSPDDLDKLEDEGRLHSHIVDGEQMFLLYELKAIENQLTPAV